MRNDHSNEGSNTLFLAYFTTFWREQIKLGLCDLRAVCVFVNLSPHPFTFGMPEPVYI
jgi:hypothetical protein